MQVAVTSEPGEGLIIAFKDYDKKFSPHLVRSDLTLQEGLDCENSRLADQWPEQIDKLRFLRWKSKSLLYNLNLGLAFFCKGQVMLTIQ